MTMNYGLWNMDLLASVADNTWCPRASQMSSCSKYPKDENKLMLEVLILKQ